MPMSVLGLARLPALPRLPLVAQVTPVHLDQISQADTLRADRKRLPFRLPKGERPVEVSKRHQLRAPVAGPSVLDHALIPFKTQPAAAGGPRGQGAVRVKWGRNGQRAALDHGGGGGTGMGENDAPGDGKTLGSSPYLLRQLSGLWRPGHRP